LADLLPPLERELRAYAYRMLGGYADAEDAVQEASVRAWTSFESLADRSSFRAWMYRIVSNVCYDVLRTRKRRALPEEKAPAVPPGPPPNMLRPMTKAPMFAVRSRKTSLLGPVSPPVLPNVFRTAASSHSQSLKCSV
jgi:RNA polymerase sigma factor (sigma-70 family)